MIKEFWNDESGIGVVEIILILVVLVALIVIFKDKITQIVQDAFGSISDGSDDINGGIKIDD
ncbi:MAG: Flp1 family type IVb pilin [Lachnospiraceae bacterium]|jgi:Flp pilus assembly pilin Flp|nr:Flp1 family type IVb pilin [Lachnospiraceae bacterium]MEE3460429.1 Flp1 family type IVb pilin [Lachnospiraceae bacterium]